MTATDQISDEEMDEEMHEKMDDDIRRRGPTRFIAALTLLLVLAVAGTYLGLVLTAPLPAAKVSISQPSVTVGETAPIAAPAHGSSLTRIVPAGPILGATTLIAAGGPANSSDPLPIASITKLITALVILDAKPMAQGELGPTITFTKADSDLYDDYYVRQATVQPMKSGSTMTLHDALEMMLVASASNYAEAVSTWSYGSQSRFLTATRTWLTKNGLLSTTIVEPTGLDPRNLSTMDDLILLADLALAHPVVAEIVAMPKTSIDGVDPTNNNNDLVGTLGIDGIKTGTLPAAGSCLLYSATVMTDAGVPVRVTGVILGGENRYSVGNDVRALIESVQRYPQTVTLIEAGARLGSYTTSWGATAALVAGSSASVVTWGAFPVVTDIATRQLYTGKEGADFGKLTFGLGVDNPIGVPLVLGGAISEPDAWWRITHPQELLAR